jgi:hypothetical protein
LDIDSTTLEDKDMETFRMTLMGNEVEILRPRFGFYPKWTDKEKSLSLGTGVRSWNDPFDPLSHKGDFRHFTLQEFTALLGLGFPKDRDRTPDEWQATEILGDFFTAIVLERGINPQHRHWGRSIYLNHGLRLERETILVYDRPDGKVEKIYNPCPGHRISDEVVPLSFSLERLFRRYNPNAVTLKELDKSNPDLVEHLFGREYEELPAPFLTAQFELPPNMIEVGEVMDRWGVTNIWPLTLNFCFEFPEDKSDLAERDLSSFAWTETTFTTQDQSRGMQLLIRDATKGDAP